MYTLSFTPPINNPLNAVAEPVTALITTLGQEPSSSDSEVWDITSFMSAFSSTLTDVANLIPMPLLLLMTLAGLASLTWGGVRMLTKIMNGGVSTISWGQVIMPIVMGGVTTTMSFILQSNKGKMVGNNTVTPPTATPSPVPTSPGTVPDPIVLPEIQNLGFLWLIPVVLITLGVLYVLVRKINHDRAAGAEARMEKARQLLLQEKIAQNIARRWDAVVANHQRLKKLYLESETDWDMLFSYPALQDVSVPETSALVHALMTADDCDPAQPDSLTEVSDLSDYSYVRAVNKLATAWKRALENAQKIGQSGIPREERKTIKQIRNLLNLAENSGATPSERELAYSRAQLLMKTLTSVTVPPALMIAIESGQRLAIEAAPAAKSSAIVL